VTETSNEVLLRELRQEIGRRTGPSPLAYPALVVFVYLADGSGWSPWIWALAVLVPPVSVIRTIIARRLADGVTPDASWRAYVAATLANAAVWGFFSAGLLVEHPLDHVVAMVLVINAGLGGAAVGTISLSYSLARAYYLLLLGGTLAGTLAMWAQSGVEGLILSFLVLLCMVTMRGLSERISTSFRQGLEDRFRLMERTEELTRARRDAEAAATAKSAFLATMSHEIRTPLNGVLGMAALLAGSELDEEQRDQVATLTSSGESLLAVINDILDYSKLEAGRVEFESIPFDPSRLVEEVGALLAPTAHGGALEFATIVDPALPPLLVGDPVRIRQVLLNLVGNAVKFTTTGGVTVELSATHDPDGVRMAVIDTGCGFSEEQRTRLFQAFSQLDASTTRRHGGTGLGLVISNGLVTGMSGRLEVESVPHRGSTFEARLPHRAAALAEVDERWTVHPGPVRAPTDCPWERVVVVDPWPDNRRAARALLDPTALEVIDVDTPRALTRSILTPATRTLLLARVEDHEDVTDRLATLAIEVATAYTASSGTSRHRLATLAIEVATAYTASSGTSRQALPEGERRIPRPLRRSTLERLLQSRGVRNEPDATTGECPTGRGHVLVVEDNAVNQKLATMLLQRAGFTSEVASNGEEGASRALADDAAFDAIIMDCQMPVMDGFEATRRIREAEATRGRHVPIVAMTANAMAEDRARCLEAGMDEYLTKPVRIDALASILDRLVVRRAA